jgi:hypothetical protein
MHKNLSSLSPRHPNLLIDNQWHLFFVIFLHMKNIHKHVHIYSWRFLFCLFGGYICLSNQSPDLYSQIIFRFFYFFALPQIIFGDHLESTLCLCVNLWNNFLQVELSNQRFLRLVSWEADFWLFFRECPWVQQLMEGRRRKRN